MPSLNSQRTPRRPVNVTSNTRAYLPFTDQTNPNKFPPYEFTEYPKMMLQPDGKPFIDEQFNEPVTVHDADEEAEWRRDHPETLTVGGDPGPLNQAERDELEELRALRDAQKKPAAAASEPASKPNPLTASIAPKKPTTKGGATLKDRSGRLLPKNLD